MNFKIEDVQGIGPINAKKLTLVKIVTTKDLLKKCCSVTGRKKVASITGVGESQLLRWTHLADLMRVFGIGPQYSELLESSGAGTIKELRNRDATILAAKMAEVNHFKRVCASVPAQKTVQEWIDCARHLNPMISY